MSKDDVKNFFVSLARDQAAADELAAAQNDAEFIDKALEFAGRRSVTLDRADIEGYLVELRASGATGDEELSDEQLADVTGGYCFCQVNRIPKSDDEGKGGASESGKLA